MAKYVSEACFTVKQKQEKKISVIFTQVLYTLFANRKMFLWSKFQKWFLNFETYLSKSCGKCSAPEGLLIIRVGKFFDQSCERRSRNWKCRHWRRRIRRFWVLILIQNKIKSRLSHINAQALRRWGPYGQNPWKAVFITRRWLETGKG